MNAIFTYNFDNKTIVGTKSAINRANKGLSPEYGMLCEMLADHPDFTVAEKQIKHKADKKVQRSDLPPYGEVHQDATQQQGVPE